MNVRALAVLLAVFAPFAGCAGNGEPANPNLLAPKLVLDATPEGEVVAYLHSAFGERRYDSLALLVDDGAPIERDDAFSLEHRWNARRFHLTADAEAANATFRLEGTFELSQERSDRIDVAFLEDGEWEDTRSASLPFERILERVEEENP